jgi:hypothetical protein
MQPLTTVSCRLSFRAHDISGPMLFCMGALANLTPSTSERCDRRHAPGRRTGRTRGARTHYLSTTAATLRSRSFHNERSRSISPDLSKRAIGARGQTDRMNALCRLMAPRMTRREFLTALSVAATWPFAARAQQVGRTYRLGALMGHPRDVPVNLAFLEQFPKDGFIEGKNLAVDWRAGGQLYGR